ncbi:hypothetical protein G6F58_013409 [Rhizopus delemar]|nr:hypothetical protein G6F58_013409 [Rhizopus delemar]
MIIGTLPVVIAVCANLRNARRDGKLPWKRLAPSLALIALGIGCVNQVELAALRQDADADLGRYAFREWHADFTPEQAGVYVLKVRATNTAGETQPLDPLWNPSGYMRNVVETVRVNAA